MHQFVAPSNNPIMFIRLSSGEDILAEVTKSKKNRVVVNNPTKIVYLLGKHPGSIMLSLVEWIFSKVCTTQSFNLDRKDVQIICTPSDELIQYYWSFMLEKDNPTIDYFVPGKVRRPAKVQSTKNTEPEDLDIASEEDVPELTEKEMEMIEEAVENMKSRSKKKKVLH